MENFRKDGDTLLVHKAAGGDQSAFAMLVAKYRNRLYRTLSLMLHQEEDTWDLMQDTLLRAYQALPKLQNPETFPTWLLKIAMNLAINHLKKRNRARKYYEKFEKVSAEAHSPETPDDIVERKEIAERLWRHIAELPPKQKSALVLCDVEGYSYKEIAEILQCRIGTVMSRLYYARKFLRNRLESGMAIDSIPVCEGMSESLDHSAAKKEIL